MFILPVGSLCVCVVCAVCVCVYVWAQVLHVYVAKFISKFLRVIYLVIGKWAPHNLIPWFALYIAWRQTQSSNYYLNYRW